MKDKYGTNLKAGDFIVQLVDNDLHEKGTRWKVIAFGVEPSSKRKIAVIKSSKEYLMCAYQSELNFFKKEM